MLVTKVWQNCTVGFEVNEFNLSYECLSKASNLGILMIRSEEYRNEIMGEVQPVDDMPIEEEWEGEQNDYEISDEVDVPLNIIQREEMNSFNLTSIDSPFTGSTKRVVPDDLPTGYRHSSRIGQRGALSYEEPDTDSDSENEINAGGQLWDRRSIGRFFTASDVWFDHRKYRFFSSSIWEPECPVHKFESKEGQNRGEGTTGALSALIRKESPPGVYHICKVRRV
ncbi:hypothetical protein K440DRAFT_637473 [Wilcoxina mikolae CBS 423.85]|nr:hypothetical protein K440DRAFT_637473 [Wilcoxina mikolae CBS 423.85]